MTTDPITDPVLIERYRRCATLTRQYGTTYYWGAALLTRPRRRHVHAVYALCRLADDIVDDQTVNAHRSPVEIAAALADFAARLRSALAAGGSSDPVLAAVVHTVIVAGIDPECFDRFFAAMAMDLHTNSYATWEDLCGYMEGSAAVIGEMMLPVLAPGPTVARNPARALGFAFQLSNFLRDVGEDLDLGRVYLPQEDLRRFGVDISTRSVTPERGGFHGVSAAAKPGALRTSRHRNSATARPVREMCWCGAGAVLADPRSYRGRRL